MERSASLVMLYLHPWTLIAEAADIHVPHLSQLRQPDMTWQSSMLQWFDGRVLSAESKRYIENFLVVTRTRPQDGNRADANSDDQISDEELTLGREDLKDALKTHVGSTNKTEDEEIAANSGSHAAVDICKTVWLVPEDDKPKKQTSGRRMEKEQLDKILASAKISRRGENTAVRAPADSRDASATEMKLQSTENVMAWLRTVGQRRDTQGNPVVKKKQMDLLEIVANRICLEIRALNDPNVDVGEPLLWCLHGLPGTGKTFVLKLLKELFEEVLGWEMGMEYQMAALQAVTAAELEGDTIHHAHPRTLAKRNVRNNRT